MFTLRTAHIAEMFAHAAEARPIECCGLIGGSDERAQTIYRLLNIARDATVSYEAAPDDLFTAQRLMRSRGEELLGIYHSHPRSANPLPSETDVRLAYYPSAIYFIIGLEGDEPKMRGFRIDESARTFERISYAIDD